MKDLESLYFRRFELETFNMRDGERKRTVYVSNVDYADICRRYPERGEGNVTDTLARNPNGKR